MSNESSLERARRLVLYYDYIFKNGWPKRIHVWAFHRMPFVPGQRVTGGDVIDFYKKLANKKEFFALLDEFKYKKTPYESSL